MHTEIFITEILKWCLGFANKNVVAKAKSGCGYRWKKTGVTWKTHTGESVHLTKVKWKLQQLYHRLKIKDVKGYPFLTCPLRSHNIKQEPLFSLTLVLVYNINSHLDTEIQYELWYMLHFTHNFILNKESINWKIKWPIF